MNKKTFKLDPDSNIPFEIELNEQKNETHSLLRVIKARQCKGLNVLLINKNEKVSKKIPAKTFTQLDLGNCSKFSIEADFISAADSYLEIDVYTGTWEEMILSEVELSFSDSPFYISCNKDVKEFMIGEENHSRMDVKQDPDGGFLIITTIVDATSQIAEIKNHIAANTEGAQIIGRLYGRIKGRINGKDFHERQEENKDVYSVNFNKTFTEGLNPIKSIEQKSK